MQGAAEHFQEELVFAFIDLRQQGQFSSCKV